jgi:hypothetical protein
MTTSSLKTFLFTFTQIFVIKKNYISIRNNFILLMLFTKDEHSENWLVVQLKEVFSIFGIIIPER